MEDNFGYASLLLPIKYKDTVQYYCYKKEKRLMMVSNIDYVNGMVSFIYKITDAQLYIMSKDIERG